MNDHQVIKYLQMSDTNIFAINICYLERLQDDHTFCPAQQLQVTNGNALKINDLFLVFKA